MSSSDNMLKPALIGGVVAGFLSAIPIINCINCACCALVVGGGFLAAALYLNDRGPSPQPPYGEGAILGILTGAVSAFVSTLISLPFQLFMGTGGFGGGMEEALDALEDANLPPETYEALAQMIEMFGGGGFSAFGLIVGFFFSLVISGIFAMLGSILGVAVLHKG